MICNPMQLYIPDDQLEQARRLLHQWAHVPPNLRPGRIRALADFMAWLSTQSTSETRRAVESGTLQMMLQPWEGGGDE